MQFMKVLKKTLAVEDVLDDPDQAIYARDNIFLCAPPDQYVDLDQSLTRFAGVRSKGRSACEGSSRGTALEASRPCALSTENGVFTTENKRQAFADGHNKCSPCDLLPGAQTGWQTS